MQGGNWVNVSPGSGSTRLKWLSVTVNKKVIDSGVHFSLYNRALQVS